MVSASPAQSTFTRQSTALPISATHFASKHQTFGVAWIGGHFDCVRKLSPRSLDSNHQRSTADASDQPPFAISHRRPPLTSARSISQWRASSHRSFSARACGLPRALPGRRRAPSPSQLAGRAIPSWWYVFVPYDVFPTNWLVDYLLLWSCRSIEAIGRPQRQ